jgi:hypothetical protein
MLNISNHDQSIDGISKKITSRAWGKMADEKEQKIEEIKSSVEYKLKNLVLSKVTGRVLVSILLEINMSQGFIGSALIQSNEKNRWDKII